MVLSGGYVFREAGTNLRRNFLVTVAAILTITVCLTFVGAALLLKQAVARGTSSWRDDVELHIVMNSKLMRREAASPAQVAAVRAELESLKRNGQIKRYSFVNQSEAYQEFKRYYVNQPEQIKLTTEDDMPEQFRVVPTRPELTEQLGARLEKGPGVNQVNFAKDLIDTIKRVTSGLQKGFLIVAGVLLVAAVLLILTNIQIAILGRRREIAVMKLVGATNWFIRLPYMVEGIIQGLIGSTLSAFAVYMLWSLLLKRARGDAFFVWIPGLSETLVTAAVVVAVGIGVGAVGSALAVRRFLDV